MTTPSFALKKTTAKKPIPVSKKQGNPARIIASEQGKILFCNPAFITLCDNTDNIEGQNITHILEFDDPSEVFQSAGIFSKKDNAIHALRDGQYSVTLKANNKSLSLQFDWIEPQKGTRYLIACAEEITAREKLLHYVSEKIKEKNNTQSGAHHFLDLAFDAQSIITPQGQFLSINKTFTEIFGYDFDTLQAKTLLDLIHPADKKAAQEALEPIKNSGHEKSIDFESRCLTADNKTLWIQWKHKRVDNKIYTLARDITALKGQEETLTHHQNKLAEAEAIGHIGQWRWDVGGESIAFSDELFRIFGVEKESFSPTLDNINGMLHRQDSERMMHVFQRAIIEQNGHEMDFCMTRPDGETRYIRCEGRCAIDDNGEVVALYGIMQDVTETTMREHDLIKAKEGVENAYAAKTQFLANMSHELRTPLNAIIGFSEIMQQQLLGPIGTEKYLEYVGGILESGEHLLDLISDILDMSRIEAGKYDLSLEKFNLAKIIRLAVHMTEGRAVDSGIKIKTEINNEDITIVADRRAVMQMVLNLLSNAIKFSHDNGLVTLQLIEREKFFSIIIKDNGIGIPANKLANITQPFEQAQSHYTRDHEGSGLGLAITKELAEMHGGTLRIESKLNVGTTTTIRLPYEAEQQ